MIASSEEVICTRWCVLPNLANDAGDGNLHQANGMNCSFRKPYERKHHPYITKKEEVRKEDDHADPKSESGRPNPMKAM